MDIDSPITNTDRKGSSGSSAHSGHGASTDSSSSSSGHAMGAMLFHTSFSDALYTSAFHPKTKGQYAGVIIFLIVLTVIYRFLLAFKSISEHNWARRDIARNREVVIAGKAAEGSQESVSEKDDGGRTKEEKADAAAAAAGLNTKPVSKEASNGWGIPWRISTELPRAVLSAVTAGLGYMLMLAVMTMNVGYFFAVVSGYFLGDLIFGRFIRTGDH